MRADPDKHHVPTAADAARWYALAEVAQQIATGSSKAWHELERLAKACDKATVFGPLNDINHCCLLQRISYAAAHSLEPHRFDDMLRDHAEAVKAAFYDWEAGRG
ncbi:hypothetical protein [Asticcacaulis sp.]|uniref:hypothetical protein n=1 Tax=Asticcacaulis sp. TaxID=1872648 RepID=UPI003F7BDF30